jgi:NADPH-dependent 2,4-dienoyl-CoA reductase/sulfur reductase-like enzyme
MPMQDTIREPARDIPVFRRCDVLVIGGGPAGSAAAASAARLGADTMLVERTATSAACRRAASWSG